MVQYNMSIPTAAFNLMYVEGFASAIMHNPYKVRTLMKYCESTTERMQNKHINLCAFLCTSNWVVVTQLLNMHSIIHQECKSTESDIMDMYWRNRSSLLLHQVSYPQKS